MALNYTTITGTFKDGAGNNQTGSVVFTPSANVYAAGVPVVTTANPVNAVIVNGNLQSASGGAVTLLSTDNSGLTYDGLTGFFYWTVSITVGTITRPAWSFFLPHTPSPVDLYSLASTGGSSGGASLPLTTLGDTLYENATPAPARLPGNTTSVKQFLTQTGTGSVSAAPAWAGIVSGDVPDLSLTYNTIKPWQFFVDSATYGAKGDGKVLGDVVLNATTTITSASASFTNNDVNKYIMIHGALGTTGGPLITTIASVTNSTTAVLASGASVSGSNYPAVYGTDDTAAINAAVTAAGSYATSHSFFAEVVFGAKIYILGTGPTQVGNGTSTPTFNTQIPLPYPNANGTTQKLILGLTGAGDCGALQYWESLIPNVAGTALVSMLNPSSGAANSATFGRQSVIGGPSGSAGFTGGFANVKVVVKGIGVWAAIYHNLIAFDFGYVSAMRVAQSGAQIFAPTGVNGGILPYLNNISTSNLGNATSIGFRTPVDGNNLDQWMDDVAAEGYEVGFLVFDHLAAGRMNSIYCDVVLKWDGTMGSSGTAHGIFIQSMAAEAYNGGFRTNGGACQVFINWDTEVVPGAYDISDGSNLYGYFYFGDKVDNRAPIISGSINNLKLINTNLGPGHMSSPPSVPASTSPISPLIYRDAWVTVHTGAGVTVSAITIDGTATGLTMAASSSLAVAVPSGKTIALTYAGGTPTWDWWLS